MNNEKSYYINKTSHKSLTVEKQAINDMKEHTFMNTQQLC